MKNFIKKLKFLDYIFIVLLALSSVIACINIVQIGVSLWNAASLIYNIVIALIYYRFFSKKNKN